MMSVAERALEFQVRVWAAAIGATVDVVGAPSWEYWVVVDTAGRIRELPDLLSYEGMGKLLEAMRERGWTWSADDTFGHPYCVGFFGWSSNKELENFIDSATTLPHAVLFAAAKALNIPKPPIPDPCTCGHSKANHDAVGICAGTSHPQFEGCICSEFNPAEADQKKGHSKQPGF